MNLPRRVPVLLVALLVAPLLALVPAAAHKGPYGTYYDTSVSTNPECNPYQNPHDYGTPDSATIWLWTAGAETAAGALAYVAGDYAASPDCATWLLDPVGYHDYDHEFGTGGGFFPAGPWAADSTCDYDLTPHHGSSFTVTPVGTRFAVGSATAVQFIPTLDPKDDDGLECFHDGVIAPDLDPGDFFQECVTSCTVPFPPGFDGGYHVWVHPVLASASYPPPAVGVAPQLSGHIWSS